MRVTAETKVQTRRRILEVAGQLFAAGGFDGSTTRDIANAAGIANGTLFNYFPNKETILAALVAEVAAAIDAEFEKRNAEEGSLEEALFAFVAAGLRKLKPWRKHLPILLETLLNPLTMASTEDVAALRLCHLETVARLTRQHGRDDLPAVTLQLYWTLYVGVLMFWARDISPRQEDTLALLDSSLAMFTNWLQAEKPNTAQSKKEEV